MNEHAHPSRPSSAKARPVYAWPGGKARMLKHLLPQIPEHTCYCEPFFGGGAVFFAHEQSPHEVINDINGELIAFMRNAKFHLDELLDQMDLVLNSRQEFEDYLGQPGLTEIQRAARWFIRHRLSFGGMGKTFAVTRTHSLVSRSQRLLAIRAMSHRLDRTHIENRDWAKILELYDAPETFFFLDPPYFDAGGAAYDGWDELTLNRFAGAVRALKGRWMVTFQDCPEVRAAFDGYPLTGKIGQRYLEVIIKSEPGQGPARKGRLT